MTKEEILIKYLGELPMHYVNGSRVTSNVELAMDEYAKQQVVEFNKWVKAEGHYCGFGNCWYDDTGEGIAKNTEEIYNQFIEQQNKTNVE